MWNHREDRVLRNVMTQYAHHRPPPYKHIARLVCEHNDADGIAFKRNGKQCRDR